MLTLCRDAPDHGLLRAITVPMIAKAMNTNRTTCEPDNPPKQIAIASVPVNDPPCLRIQSLRAQPVFRPRFEVLALGTPRGDLGLSHLVDLLIIAEACCVGARLQAGLSSPPRFPFLPGAFGFHPRTFA
jgi:hypothetical protein